MIKTVASIFPETLPTHVLHVIVCEQMTACIDLQEVEQVFPLVAVQAISDGPNYLVGLMNVHGTMLPVIDLACRFGFGLAQKYTIDTPIILCQSGKYRGGFVVREVIGVTQPTSADIQMSEQFVGARPMLKAAVSTAHGMSLLLDSKRVLAIDLSESPCDEQPLHQRSHYFDGD